MDSISGSCLCGKITFECKNNFDSFHLCHCIQCQKTTGSAHASNLFTNINNITWLTGQVFIKRYDVPNRAISKAFCIECGSGVPYNSGTGKSLVVPAGCLNGTPNILPQDNIFCSEKASWYDAGVSAKGFDEFPN
jgi:hypothetical protein